MGVVVDTSVVIEVERRGGGHDALATVIREGPVVLSIITVGELLYGLRRTADVGRHARRSAFIEGVFAVTPVLAVEMRDARAYAALRGALERQGTPIGPNDLWIAAQALARGHAVATANVREFARVPGLGVIG